MISNDKQTDGFDQSGAVGAGVGRGEGHQGEDQDPGFHCWKEGWTAANAQIHNLDKLIFIQTIFLEILAKAEVEIWAFNVGKDGQLQIRFTAWTNVFNRQGSHHSGKDSRAAERQCGHNICTCRLCCYLAILSDPDAGIQFLTGVVCIR